MPEPQLLHWRERAFVSPAMAGEILCYSSGYIRRLVSAGVLKAIRQTKGGPLFIVVESISDYLDRLEAEQAPVRAEAGPTPSKYGHLTVVK
ncbi:hypothetical protein SLNSH_02730 [Alsobacter soli]|uniref:Helix-turn-helix domain-containing protein n=1 Tax=Alsobacter soli TaxID=2109933 RepID=A0A2T1HYS1_9HYPH|nr:hypothetical protein [Alsobacter soli]PSC06728.1 hypothetical protein SLNSH_02730 [Alsobacter soli]